MIEHVRVRDIPFNDPLWDLKRGTSPRFSEWWHKYQDLSCFIYKPGIAIHGLLVYKLSPGGGEIIYKQVFPGYNPKDTVASIDVKLYKAYHGVVIQRVCDLFS